MRVRIDREREERRVPAGWFARADIAVYCIYLTIHFGEEERYLLRHTGIGHYGWRQLQEAQERQRSCARAPKVAG